MKNLKRAHPTLLSSPTTLNLESLKYFRIASHGQDELSQDGSDEPLVVDCKCYHALDSYCCINI